MTYRIPVDSTDARELRELEAEHEREQAVAALHDPRCRNGWLGETPQGHPIPCTHCRPHLKARTCLTCSTPAQACEAEQAAGHRCCPDCSHERT